MSDLKDDYPFKVLTMCSLATVCILLLVVLGDTAAIRKDVERMREADAVDAAEAFKALAKEFAKYVKEAK